ncbi:response regulator transcription factor [Agrobacterium pusense]|uniref:response regulator transcription factor n=1 Tax=Agrobacterium pusense TaxID=648995 RepID=UPI003FD63B18
MRILVAEDDKRIANSLSVALTSAGFVTEISRDGEDAWFRGDCEAFDAIILDLGLPVLDGLTILKRWRRDGRNTPVLILTARGDWSERVEGIECGADDYVVKPFRMEEVVARVRAIVRRAAGFSSPIISVGRYTLDTKLKQVFADGVPIALSPQEYRLFTFMAHRPGKVVSQAEITEHLYAQDDDRLSNAVEVLVGRLRRRLGADIIVTRRGLGYLLGSGN